MRLVPERLIWVGGYMALVLFLSSLPGRQLGRWGLTGLPLDLGHIPLFTGLCLVTLWAVVAPPFSRAIAVATALIGFAAADEWLQLGVPGRVASLADFARDLLGIALGIALFKGFEGLGSQRKGKLPS